MIQQIDLFQDAFEKFNADYFCPLVKQMLSEEELINVVPDYDGWIIGDDAATKNVFAAGKKGALKAAVKWGIGVDNVDFDAARELGIPVTNTPNMFGKEVADIAMSYVTALARNTFFIDRQIRAGHWVKPAGVSLAGKNAALVGFGDIGKNIARRLIASEMEVYVYDPFYVEDSDIGELPVCIWPQQLELMDFIIFACSLTRQNKYMLDEDSIKKIKHGVRIINVARGQLIKETVLVEALESELVHSAALDVYENEPLLLDSQLRKFERCILGSHNSSNTIEAVQRTSERAIDILFQFLHN
ncbi:MAG: phosphoglycerate dehydrogenase [Ignavibacteria bacterium]|nr:phosphoglycerate dehydrogenase [Ignavibacteria bacterium]